ncbi:PIG-L deacetylase family protein [Corynebacterium striatum]
MISFEGPALVVVAHPDDETLGAGGTIAKWSQKYNVEVVPLILGDRISERHPHNVDGKTMTRNACQILGCKEPLFGGFGNGGRLLAEYPPPALTSAIISTMRSVNPGCILYHRHGDTHLDHDLVNQCVRYALMRVDDQKISWGLEFEVPSSSERGMRLDQGQGFYVDISDELPLKQRALACYETELEQNGRSRSLQGIEKYAAFRGLTAGCEYSEFFRVAYGRG